MSRHDLGGNSIGLLQSRTRSSVERGPAGVERAEPHVIGPMRTSYLTGLETWFTLPDRPGAPPPPPYKMALLTWMTTAVTVPLMTWLVTPRVTRALRGWLFTS